MAEHLYPGHLGGFQSFVFTNNADVNILAHLPTYTLVKFLVVQVLSQKEYALETLVNISKLSSKKLYQFLLSIKHIHKT